MDGVSHRLCAAQGLLRESRPAGIRGKADRQWPLHGRRLRGQRLSAAQGAPEILGWEAAVRHGRVQVCPGCDYPRRGDREWRFRFDAGSALRGIRPAQDQDRTERGLPNDVRLGLLFITNGGVMDDKNVRLAMCHAVDKQSIIKRLLRGYG